ncbi:NAD/NADP octopine/nopaline dehydrogenase family protein [Achromobacter xylosoxidans]
MDTGVSIIGTGHCGCAMAADLLGRRVPTLLYAHPQHCRTLEAIRQQGYLDATGGIIGRFFPQLTTSMADAVGFSRILVITIPAYGHNTIIDELAKFDLRDHIVICITGNFFSFVARQHLTPRALMETATSPYASRVVGNEVKVVGVKRILPIASLPAKVPPDLRDTVQSLFDLPLDWRANVLEIGLMCVTGVVHPTPMLMNAGWVETTGGNFYFYRDGMSPSVGKVIETLDTERQHVARQFGLHASPVVDLMNAYYDHSFENFTAFARHTPEHNSMPATPPTLHHRFVDQDVPYVLVPWLELGITVNTPCPTIAAITQLASIANDTDYLKVGRNLRAMGLQDATREDILALVEAPALTLAS